MKSSSATSAHLHKGELCSVTSSMISGCSVLFTANCLYLNPFLWVFRLSVTLESSSKNVCSPLFLDKYLLEGNFCNGTYFEYLSQIFCIELLIWDGRELILTSCVVVVCN